MWNEERKKKKEKGEAMTHVNITVDIKTKQRLEALKKFSSKDSFNTIINRLIDNHYDEINQMEKL